jgi:hypothetical protein
MSTSKPKKTTLEAKKKKRMKQARTVGKFDFDENQLFAWFKEKYFYDLSRQIRTAPIHPDDSANMIRKYEGQHRSTVNSRYANEITYKPDGGSFFEDSKRALTDRDSLLAFLLYHVPNAVEIRFYFAQVPHINEPTKTKDSKFDLKKKTHPGNLTLIMKGYDKDGVQIGEPYDIFELCPPGNCS